VPYLTDEEIVDVFINTPLEGDYNLIKSDLVKLAHAFVQKAEPKIKERLCSPSSSSS
jgi:hypothetical protein